MTLSVRSLSVTAPECCRVVSLRGDRTMATADTDGDSSTVHSKSVMLTAYFGSESCDSWRDAADNVPVESDFTSEEVEVRTDDRLVVDNVAEAEDAAWSDRQDFGSSLDDGFGDTLRELDTGDTTVVTFTNEYTSWVNGGYVFSREFRKLVGMDDVLSSFDKTPDFFTFKSLETDSGARLSYNVSMPEGMKTLKHPSEASTDEKYEEGSEPRPAISVTVKLEEGSPEDVNWLSDTVMPALVREVANIEGVQETRIRDCERTVTQEGACYDL